jgi:hypothetical protein
MALWYIDALDARAGIGLATYRDADLHTYTIDLGKPAVFIGPPFFQGESVASRAIGFAATRGSFQLGLFLDDEEIAFATLQGVCEFIRRVYISSGGGDTDSGISPAPVVPNPEPGGGEFPSPLQGEYSIARGVLKFVSFMSEDIASISQLKHSKSGTKQLNRREGTYKVSLLETLGPFTDVDAFARLRKCHPGRRDDPALPEPSERSWDLDEINDEIGANADPIGVVKFPASQS